MTVRNRNDEPEDQLRSLRQRLEALPCAEECQLCTEVCPLEPYHGTATCRACRECMRANRSMRCPFCRASRTNANAPTIEESLNRNRDIMIYAHGVDLHASNTNLDSDDNEGPGENLSIGEDLSIEAILMTMMILSPRQLTRRSRMHFADRIARSEASRTLKTILIASLINGVDTVRYYSRIVPDEIAVDDVVTEIRRATNAGYSTPTQLLAHVRPILGNALWRSARNEISARS